MAITAKTVQDIREKLGETQAEFGDRFGVHQATVHRWEKDGPPKRGSTLAMLDMAMPHLIAQAKNAKA